MKTKTNSKLLLIAPDARHVAAAIDGGVDLVQLRSKEFDDDAFLQVAREMAALCHARGVKLILNDRVHLVQDAGADGAHVGEDDMAPEEARRILGPDLLLGVSTHDAAEVAAAAGRGADYAGLGPMFPTATKDLSRAPGGAGLVRAALPVATVPVFCIGGIRAENVRELVAAGATRIAVSAAILDAERPGEAAAQLARAL